MQIEAICPRRFWRDRTGKKMQGRPLTLREAFVFTMQENRRQLNKKHMGIQFCDIKD